MKPKLEVFFMKKDKEVKLNKSDKSRLLKSVEYNSEINVKLIHQWIKDTGRIAGLVFKETIIYPYPAVFWIRLYGLIVEVRKEHAIDPKLQLWESQGLLNAETVFILRAKAAVGDAINAMMKGLSRNELIIIDYYRQTNAHVLQKGYNLGVLGDKYPGGEINRLKEHYDVPTLDNEKIEIDILSLNIRAELKKFNFDECKMIKSIAEKINIKLQKILEDADFYYTLTDYKVGEFLANQKEK